jgi:hypothetical protein
MGDFTPPLTWRFAPSSPTRGEENRVRQFLPPLWGKVSGAAQRSLTEGGC